MHSSRWIQRTVLFVALVVVALAWVNSRTFMMRRNQPGGRPVVLAGYYYFHAMAVGLESGRIGQFDDLRLQRYLSKNDSLAPYEKRQAGSREHWLNYYTLDVGYLFIVEAARLVFPGLPDSIIRSLALQLLADAALVGFIYWLFSAWNRWIGVLAGLLYTINVAFCFLASVAYYYYWDVPLAFLIIGAVLSAYRHSNFAGRWLALGAVLLGAGVWLRGTWWPLAAFVFILVWTTPQLRQRVPIPICIFGLIAAPQVIRSSVARGSPALSTRATWHVAMVGLGYVPNPYGFIATDESVFGMTQEKYGIGAPADDYFAHDQAAKRLFLDALRQYPRFVLQSFLQRLVDSILARPPTNVLSYWQVDNMAYRLLALVGCLAMLAVGGELRFLAIAACGMYWLYVVLTCAFFYVGDMYDNVPEVALLVCFVGGVQAIIIMKRPALAASAPNTSRLRGPFD